MSLFERADDLLERGESVDYRKISDKALCLGGGVLEALLRLA
jgi:xanthine dehydrogenase accessory factor